MVEVRDTLGPYYEKCFAEHGASARGVDWHDAGSLEAHYDKMLAVIEPEHAGRRVSLLDVGCGYGGLLDHAKATGRDLAYTGIDLVGDMIGHGQAKHPDATFMKGDLLAVDPPRRFDYVVANGVLTEKLDVSIRDFGRFARSLIARMFACADRGIAFNMMTTSVNFMAANLYYQNPGELIAFVDAELSPKWRIDHAYKYYDFTMYVYRP